MSPIAISISQLLLLWRHSHYDVSRLRRSQPPFSLWCRSHFDVIRYWAGHAHHRHICISQLLLLFRRTEVKTKSMTWATSVWERHMIQKFLQKYGNLTKKNSYRRKCTLRRSYPVRLDWQYTQTKDLFIHAISDSRTKTLCIGLRSCVR